MMSLLHWTAHSGLHPYAPHSIDTANRMQTITAFSTSDAHSTHTIHCMATGTATVIELDGYGVRMKEASMCTRPVRCAFKMHLLQLNINQNRCNEMEFAWPKTRRLIGCIKTNHCTQSLYGRNLYTCMHILMMTDPTWNDANAQAQTLLHFGLA